MLSGVDGTSTTASSENRLLRVREACQSSLASNKTGFCLSLLLMGHGDLYPCQEPHAGTPLGLTKLSSASALPADSMFSICCLGLNL